MTAPVELATRYTPDNIVEIGTTSRSVTMHTRKPSQHP